MATVPGNRIPSSVPARGGAGLRRNVESTYGGLGVTRIRIIWVNSPFSLEE